jgi:hypothetical protein
MPTPRNPYASVAANGALRGRMADRVRDPSFPHQDNGRARAARLRKMDPMPKALVTGAACASAEYDPAWWFSHGDEAEAAIAICNACPVLDLCRQWANAHHRHVYGIWGATQRRACTDDDA